MSNFKLSLILYFVSIPLAFAQAPEPGDVERGKAHYQAGASYYQEARYEDALREFSEAYRLSKKPPLLFNVSLCQERLGRLDDAIASLERYLAEDPNTPDRGVVEARLRTFREQKAKATPPPPPQVTAPVAPPPPPPVEKPRRRIVTWVVGSAGILLIAGGAVAQAVASSKHNQLVSMCAPDGTCNFDGAQSLIDGGRAAVYTSYALFAVGGAALATSVVLFFLEGRSRAPSVAIAPWASPGAGGVSFAAPINF